LAASAFPGGTAWSGARVTQWEHGSQILLPRKKVRKNSPRKNAMLSEAIKTILI